MKVYPARKILDRAQLVMLLARRGASKILPGRKEGCRGLRSVGNFGSGDAREIELGFRGQLQLLFPEGNRLFPGPSLHSMTAEARDLILDQSNEKMYILFVGRKKIANPGQDRAG